MSDIGCRWVQDHDRWWRCSQDRHPFAPVVLERGVGCLGTDLNPKPSKAQQARQARQAQRTSVARLVWLTGAAGAGQPLPTPTAWPRRIDRQCAVAPWTGDHGTLEQKHMVVA